MLAWLQTGCLRILYFLFFIPNVVRQKLGAKATKGDYVGECEEDNAIGVYVKSTDRTHISCHVKNSACYSTHSHFQTGSCSKDKFPVRDG
jgi:hypothetical protein